MASSFLSPLRCAERRLADRLRDLDLRLEKEPDVWPEYLTTLGRYLEVLARLRPTTPMTAEKMAERFARS